MIPLTSPRLCKAESRARQASQYVEDTNSPAPALSGIDRSKGSAGIAVNPGERQAADLPPRSRAVQALRSPYPGSEGATWWCMGAGAGPSTRRPTGRRPTPQPAQPPT